MADLNWTAARPKDRIFTFEGQEIGTVKSVRDNKILVDDAQVWLPETAIISREKGIARLSSEYDFLGHSGKAGKSEGGLPSLMLSLTLGAASAAALVALQNKDWRQRVGDGLNQVSARGKQNLTRVRSRVGSSESGPAATPSGSSTSASSGHLGTKPGRGAATESSGPGSVIDDVPPFSTLDLSDRVITDVEREVIALITAAFPEHSLRTNAIGVHRLEGGEVATLRFTLDEVASSDLLLERLESTKEPPSALANEVIEELRSQLPPPPEK
jgi:hypothetical protein